MSPLPVPESAVLAHRGEIVCDETDLMVGETNGGAAVVVLAMK